MNEIIDLNVEIDPGCAKPSVIIRASERNELIENIVDAINKCTCGESGRITVYDGNTVVLLSPEDIFRVYIENRGLMVCTASDTYRSRLTLQEFEDELSDDAFVRVSRSEIVNLKKAVSFDLSVAGTIRITFENGTETWVARRRVKDIHERFAGLSSRTRAFVQK